MPVQSSITSTQSFSLGYCRSPSPGSTPYSFLREKRSWGLKPILFTNLPKTEAHHFPAEKHMYQMWKRDDGKYKALILQDRTLQINNQLQIHLFPGSCPEPLETIRSETLSQSTHLPILPLIVVLGFQSQHLPPTSSKLAKNFVPRFPHKMFSHTVQLYNTYYTVQSQ